MKYWFTSILFILIWTNFYSQSPDSTINTSVTDYSLKELINLEVGVASSKLQTMRESPGVISLITEEDIVNSGARDLIDILRLVPGIDFGAEWDNIIGIGVRGNNATEGKFLITIDGQSMNETNFGTFPFGLHINPSNISRVEVLRGPGSVIYGGSAELAVINIITKDAKDIKGINFNSDIAFAENSLSRNSYSLCLGKSFSESFSVSLSAYYGKANRSNMIVNTLDTTLVNYNDSSSIETANLNLKISFKNFKIIGIYDSYLSQNIENKGYILNKGFYIGARYNYRINDKVSFKPNVNYKNQLPWYFVDFSEKEFYNTNNNRFTLNLPLSFTIKNIDFLFGLENFMDNSRKVNPNTLFVSNKKNSISYYNHAAYSEIFIKTKFFNINAGGRYNRHLIYGNYFVPRISLIKVFDELHFKLLYNKAFKAPTISNIDYNKSINPEITSIFEFESGYQFNDNMNFTFNVFHINIINPILYIPNPITGADFYKNFENTGSYGCEFSYKLREKWGSIAVSYSFYKPINNTIKEYEIDNIKGVYGAFPNHTASVLSNFKISEKIYANYFINFFSKRYTYVHSDKNWESADLVSFNNSAILSLNFVYSNIINGLSISAGVYNLGNVKYYYLNSYSGWQNPIPSQSREYSLKLSYNF